MTIPITIGWPQLLLFLIAVIGVGLLISSLMGLRRDRDYYDEATGKYLTARRRYVRWGRGLSGIILLLVAISLLWVTFLVQTYLGLNSDIRVAQVHATTLSNEPNMMSVELILYDKAGHQVSDNSYAVRGNEWLLEGDVIKFPTWLNILGLHSGYKLTRLEGRYDDPNLEANAKHTVIVLNGGDDAFFKTVQEQAWTSPVIQAGYGSGTFVHADGKTYNVLISQTGLYAVPAR